MWRYKLSEEFGFELLTHRTGAKSKTTDYKYRAEGLLVTVTLFQIVLLQLMFNILLPKLLLLCRFQCV